METKNNDYIGTEIARQFIYDRLTSHRCELYQRKLQMQKARDRRAIKRITLEIDEVARMLAKCNDL